MKKAALAVFIVGVLVFGLSINAMADSDRSVWVKVPFAFHAGNTLMPAGTYQFSMRVKPHQAGNLLRIISQDGSLCENLSTNRIEGNRSDPDVHVYFNKYGDSYFLSKVKGNSLGVEVAKSRAEKQLEGSFSKPSVSVSSHSKAQRSSR